MFNKIMGNPLAKHEGVGPRVAGRSAVGAARPLSSFPLFTSAAALWLQQLISVVVMV